MDDHRYQRGQVRGQFSEQADQHLDAPGGSPQHDDVANEML